ncbi:MAG: DUF2155 domain-containing protein [Hyphomicrobiales bacterium]|nr:DUF2155 domain-containing protein [Hyphomicrobiales bacterium]
MTRRPSSAAVFLLASALVAVAPSAGFAAPKTPTEAPALPDDENKIAQPFAIFSGLDKITGRIISFDVAIDETVQFGALQVTPRACYSRPQTVAPLTDAFVEVDEITLDNKIRRIFSGWMFADSPGLHAVDHAVYDVWLTDCRSAADEKAKKAGATEPAGQAAAPPPAAAEPPAAPPPAKKPPAKPAAKKPPTAGAPPQSPSPSEN